jgi:hypothetical protein
MSTAAATGTDDDGKENTKIKMSAATGVVRKRASGNEKKYFTALNVPDKNPRKVPSVIEMKNERMTRRKVAERF